MSVADSYLFHSSKQKGVIFSDDFILRKALSRTIWKDKEQRLDYARCEKKPFKTLQKPLPQDKFHSLCTSLLGKHLTEDSLEAQVRRLIPPDTVPPEEHAALQYTLLWVIRGKLPYSTRWLWHTSGLEPLAMSYMTLLYLSRAAEINLPWLEVLHDPNRYASPLCLHTMISSGPDGPLSQSDLLSRIRGTLNMVRYQPLLKLCLRLKKRAIPSGFSYDDVFAITGYKQRKIAFTSGILDIILSESNILSTERFGLRYRHILDPTVRTLGEEVRKSMMADGLVERIVIRGGTAENFSRLHTFIEPSSSLGPDIIHENGWQGVTDRERISMNLRLYKDSKWNVEPWSEETPIQRRVLRRESLPRKRGDYSLSAKDQQVLGTLLAHTGSPFSRRFLFDRVLKMNRMSSSSCTKGLTQGSERQSNPVVNTLYHPPLEYAGLPVLLAVIVDGVSEAKVVEYADWLQNHFPYVRSRLGKTTLVSLIRVPRPGTPFLYVIKEKFGEKCEGFIANERSTHYLSLPSRLYKFKENIWSDPWT